MLQVIFFWISATVQHRNMCNTPNRSYFQRVSYFTANFKYWLLIGRKLILAVILHFLCRKLILAVFWQPVNIETCVIHQIVRIFSMFHKLRQNLKYWLPIGRKLILAVIRQPFKIEACVIRQIVHNFGNCSR